MIAYTTYEDLCDFPAWNNSESVLKFIVKNNLCEKVEDLINKTFYDNPKDVHDINEFLWDKKDIIASYAGYKNWDAVYCYEVCPHCGEEVELKAELSVQTCPNCGKRIVACSMCRACDANDGKKYCSNCCLSYQAEKENEENENNE